jgi:type II secretion system protein N
MKTLSKRSITVLYVLFGVAATVFFVYALFPAERAALSFQRLWERRVPGLELAFRTLSLRFPATLRFDDVVLRSRGRNPVEIRLDRVGLAPDPFSLLRGVPAVRFHGRAFGGDFSGKAASMAGKTGEGPLSLSLAVSGIDLAALGKTELLGERSVVGRLTGEAVFRGRPERFAEGNGTASFRMTNGNIGLARAMAGLASLPFDVLEGACSLGGRTVQVEGITFSGAQVNGSFKGAVHLAHDLRRSRIALTGTLRIPPLNRNLSAVVGGTMETPTVRLK